MEVINQPLYESPIEEMFGEALRSCIDELAWPKGWPIDEQVIAEFEVFPQYKLGRYRYDFAITRKSEIEPILFIECDGREFHNSAGSQINDFNKDTTVSRAGAHMMRFSGSEIYRNPYMCAYAVLIWLSSNDARCKPQRAMA